MTVCYATSETLEGHKNEHSTRMGAAASILTVTPSDLADKAVPKHVPTITELKKALPDHCFKPSVAKSLYYVVKDLAIMTVFYLAVVTAERNTALLVLALPIYWYLQGTMMWALFVLGHDCGHGSFSNNAHLNNLIGNLLHGLILVPYYPWKLSHRHHHKNTGNIDKDEIFYPVKCDLNDYAKGGKRFIPLFGFGVSWFFYLVKGYAPRAANHLNPMDPLFVKNAAACAFSLLVCAGWICGALIPYAKAYGVGWMLAHYGVPLFVFASWLVVTTFLHHQDENVPWYSTEEWNFVKGNLSSVDRHYGWAHGLVHNIGTHQIHHLFSKIPHYHLEEATDAFRSKYPWLVRKSDEPIMSAFVKMFYLFQSQMWVPKDTKIHVYSAQRSYEGKKLK